MIQGEIPPETTTSDDISCPVMVKTETDTTVLSSCKTLAQQMNRTKTVLLQTDAFSRLKMTNNGFAAGSPPQTPLGEPTALPQTP